jgi:hypothetical protein
MKAKFSSQSLLGIIIVAVGAGFLLDTLNLWDFSTVMSQWWPLTIVVVGVLSLLTNPRVLAWPLMIIVVGLLLLLKELGVLDFNVWGLIWPAILIFVGLSFISGRFGQGNKESTDDDLDLFVAFSGIDTVNRSHDFRGGRATAIFGGIALDLRQATIKKEARFDTFTAFGGLELKVPEGWVVKTSVLPLFGGWDDKSKKPESKDAPVLYLRGTCVFGGVEIRN